MYSTKEPVRQGTKDLVISIKTQSHDPLLCERQLTSMSLTADISGPPPTVFPMIILSKRRKHNFPESEHTIVTPGQTVSVTTARRKIRADYDRYIFRIVSLYQSRDITNSHIVVHVGDLWTARRCRQYFVLKYHHTHMRTEVKSAIVLT